MFLKRRGISKQLSEAWLNSVNSFLKARGPDATRFIVHEEKGEEYFILHNLLHICGEPVVQPVQRDDCLLVFNGEIYNWKQLGVNGAISDTDCIIPLYRKHGSSFIKLLDGEFAIVLYDESNQRILVSTDPFMTKPLFIGIDKEKKEIGIASYKSSLDAAGISSRMAHPNKTILIDAGTCDILSETEVYTWDLIPKTQRNESEALAAWASAFEEAVQKRALHGGKMFITLSSGYDSGCIALACNKLKIEYDTFSTENGEDVEVIKQRIFEGKMKGSLGVPFLIGKISEETKETDLKNAIREKCEPWTYVHDDGFGHPLRLEEDGGAKALTFICSIMHNLNYRVVLSGSGADEIFSDYGFNGFKIYAHSEFGGLWPDDLSANGFFPWKKFYGDTQRSYLFKDDFITGAFSIEGRYPFLDPKVVQEWLWFPASLKNKEYKYPLVWYMRTNGFPRREGCKSGFSI